MNLIIKLNVFAFVARPLKHLVIYPIFERLVLLLVLPHRLVLNVDIRDEDITLAFQFFYLLLFLENVAFVITRLRTPQRHVYSALETRRVLLKHV